MSTENLDECDYLNITELDPARIVIFKQWNRVENPESSEENMESLKQRICMLSPTDNSICHKYCGFNKFTKKTYDTPLKEDGWLSIEDDILDEYDSTNDGTLEDFSVRYKNRHMKYILNSICNPELNVFTDDKQIIFDNVYSNWKCYPTLDNYSTGFLVFINEFANKVHIYGRTSDVIQNTDDMDDIKIFNNLIGEYEPIEIFIGKSKSNDMTNFSGGHGKKWNGNSILLRIGNLNEFRYLHIGICVFEFLTSEIIKTYVSSVGNNCVPYPYAESENWCYCISSYCKTPINQHPGRIQRGHVSYKDDAEYVPLDYSKKIAKRDSDKCKCADSAEEDTGLVRFFNPVNFIHMEKTCSDPTLPAVQCLENRQQK